MRENRTYGSEGGGAQLNALSLPLSNDEDGRRTMAQLHIMCQLVEAVRH